MKTKIIATQGPSTADDKIKKEMIRAGMNIARFNFSHASFDQYKKERKKLISIAEEEGREIAFMQDVQGPRLRVGELPKEGVRLRVNDTVIFSTDPHATTQGAILIEDPHLHIDISEKDPVFLSNGAMELEVMEVKDSYIYTKVFRGGVLFSHKAVNVPHTPLTTKGLTVKDKEDIQNVSLIGVEYVAVSFVQSARDIEDARAIVNDSTKIIAKIERKQALSNIDEIIKASDGIMVARGDLGAEIPIETVPLVQKDIIRHALWHGKFAIVATEMLLSMVSQSHPTRAEVSDVANAILDGAGAVMLSDETAAGKHPTEAVKTMKKIIDHIDAHGEKRFSL